MKKAGIIAAAVAVAVLTAAAVLIFSRDNKLKIGVMPDYDSVQAVIAAEMCKNAKTVVFTSAVSREAAFRSGEIDICVSDLVAAAALVGNGSDEKIMTVTTGRYYLVSKHETLTDEIKTVGVSNATVIDYAACEMLSGTAAETLPIAQINLRLESLIRGTVDACVLPEPYAERAVRAGYFRTAEPKSRDLGVMLCRGDADRQKLTEYLAAWDKAAEYINRESVKNASERDALLKTALTKLSVDRDTVLPVYGTAAMPSDETLTGVCRFARENRIADEITPERMRSSFLR